MFSNFDKIQATIKPDTTGTTVHLYKIDNDYCSETIDY